MSTLLARISRTWRHDAEPAGMAGIGWPPGAVVAAFVMAHVAIWTAIPGFVHAGLPVDVVEGYAVSSQWLLTTIKHPALPYWLLELARMATGAIAWPAYCLSALLVGATYVIVYRLGRDILGSQRAMAGTLPLVGVFYFSWVTPELNHNIVQLPIWAGLIWLLWRARMGGGVVPWLLIGLVGALGMYAKLSTAILLAVLAGWILLDRKCRAQLSDPGPWLGLLAFLALVSPLAKATFAGNSALLEYVEARAVVPTAYSVIRFPFTEAFAASGLLLVMLVSIFWRGGASGAEPRPMSATSAGLADGRMFLAVMLAAPILLTMLTAAVGGFGLRGTWGAPMVSLAGLLVVAVLPERITGPVPARIVAGSCALLLVVPLIYAVHVLGWVRPSKTLPRVAWPQAEIARRIEAVWTAEVGRPLRYVVGDGWTGALVATWASRRPHLLLIDNDFSDSPWIDHADLARQGAMIVWSPTGINQPLPATLSTLIGTRRVGKLDVVTTWPRAGAHIDIRYAVIPPQDKAAPPGN